MLADSIEGVEYTLKKAGILENGQMFISHFLKQSFSESNVSERNEHFNLGESVDRGTNPFKFSIVLKPDEHLE